MPTIVSHAARSDARDTWPMAIVAVSACAAAVIFLYFETIAGAVAVWIGSAAHQFSFLVLPVSLYFIWIRRRDLARITPQPLPLIAVLALPLGVLWLAAEAAQVAVASQVAVVGLVQAAVLTIFGPKVYRMILFPMLFLWLMVPFGEFFLPALIEMTTSLTVASLNVLGLAAQADGNIFKAGTAEYGIVEGCASLDFLIGNMVVALVFANLMYLGFIRRALYVLSSFPVAVFANIVRTTSVVMITEYSGGEIDLAMDHGLYGWFIFCVAVLIQMRIGLRFRNSGDQPGRAVGADTILRSARNRRSQSLAGAVVALFMTICAPPVYAMVNAGSDSSVPGVTVCMPSSLEQVSAPVDPGGWLPVYEGSDAQIHRKIQVAGQRVDFFVAYYWDQTNDSEMIRWGNDVYDSESWYFLERETRAFTSESGPFSVIETRLHDDLEGRRLVWHWYWVDGRFVADPVKGKLLQAKARLFFGNKRAAVVALSMEEPADGAVAVAVLHGVLAHIPEIETMLATSLPVSEKSLPCGAERPSVAGATRSGTLTRTM